MRKFINEIRHHWSGKWLQEEKIGFLIQWKYKGIVIASWNTATNQPEQMVKTPDSIL